VTLGDLSKSWQELRDRAFGRGGMARNVSPGLAAQIEQAYGAWRAWISDRTQIVLADVIVPGTEAAEQLELLAQLSRAAKAEGLSVTVPLTASEQIAQLGDQVSSAARTGVLVVAVTALGFLIAKWIGGSRG
jgi:hypothetical protein